MQYHGCNLRICIKKGIGIKSTNETKSARLYHLQQNKNGCLLMSKYNLILILHPNDSEFNVTIILYVAVSILLVLVYNVSHLFYVWEN